MEFREEKEFTEAVTRILDETAYFQLQDLLVANPKAGDLIIGGKGLRKIRVASTGRGKRGGSRVIYYFYDMPQVILLLNIYEKNKKENLSSSEMKQLLKKIWEWKN